MQKRNIHKRFRGSVAMVAAVAVASLPLVIPSTAHAQVPPPPEGEVAQPAPEPVTGPDPADANLSEEQKMEKAKGLYIEAEQAFQAGDYATATNRYEQAYYLVPGKHGFAYKVGLAAWNLGDCKKADDYFKHFVKYETDYEKKGDQIEEAKRIIGEIAISGCAEQAEDPAPAPAAANQPATDTGPVVGDEPDLTSAEDKRKQQEADSDSELNKKGVSGLMIGGITMVVLGAGGLGLGIGSFVKARSNANELSDLSSNGTQTGFPAGDFSKESTFKMNSQISTFNTLSVVGFTVGGVLLAGGGVLIGLDVAKRKKAEKQQALKDHKQKVKLTGVSPTWMPGGGGAAASLSF